MIDQHYDIIIIGTGAGGGTLAHRLAPSGKKVLLLERGDFLPRERENWESSAVFVQGKYQAQETWYDRRGDAFHPGIHYWVGGNTKMYGAALFRLREQDFAEMRHQDGVSPAWPLGYEDFEPYYSEAEQLYQVHGQHGVDPTDPPASQAYPHPPISHEPRIQELHDSLQREGYHHLFRCRWEHYCAKITAKCSTRAPACAAMHSMAIRVWSTARPMHRRSASNQHSSTQM